MKKPIFFGILLMVLATAFAQSDSVIPVAIESTIILRNNAFAIQADTIEQPAIIAIPYVIDDSVVQIYFDTVRATVSYIANYKDTTASVIFGGNIVAKKNNRAPAWLFFFLVLQLIFLVYQKVIASKGIADMAKSFFNINIGNQIFREKENLFVINDVVQVLNSLLSFAILSYLLIFYFFFDTHVYEIKFFLILFVSIASLYFLRFASYRVLYFLLPFLEEIKFYNFIFFHNQKLLGMLLIPLIYIAAYNQDYGYYFLWISTILFLVGNLVSLYSGLSIAGVYVRKHLFHFLLYICTFEIAPIIILLKWLQQIY